MSLICTCRLIPRIRDSPVSTIQRAVRIGSQGTQQDLDRDIRSQRRVARAVDLAHAARAEGPEDFVGPSIVPAERLIRNALIIAGLALQALEQDDVVGDGHTRNGEALAVARPGEVGNRAAVGEMCELMRWSAI